MKSAINSLVLTLIFSVFNTPTSSASNFHACTFSETYIANCSVIHHGLLGTQMDIGCGNLSDEGVAGSISTARVDTIFHEANILMSTDFGKLNPLSQIHSFDDVRYYDVLQATILEEETQAHKWAVSYCQKKYQEFVERGVHNPVGAIKAQPCDHKYKTISQMFQYRSPLVESKKVTVQVWLGNWDGPRRESTGYQDTCNNGRRENIPY